VKGVGSGVGRGEATCPVSGLGKVCLSSWHLVPKAAGDTCWLLLVAKW
jgi:hypothetical protein